MIALGLFILFRGFGFKIFVLFARCIVNMFTTKGEEALDVESFSYSQAKHLFDETYEKVLKA